MKIKALIALCLASLGVTECYSADGFVSKELRVDGRIQSITIGDFNRDSRPDIAVRTHANMTVLLNTGGGDFSSRTTTPLAFGFASMSVTDYGVGRTEIAADFNGDDNLDLAIKDRNEILFGIGDGTFLPPEPIGGQHPVLYGLAATGDFNADLKPDLVYFVRGSLAILLGNGDGAFRSGPTADLGFDGQILVADFNRDGRSDLAYLRYPVTAKFVSAWSPILMTYYDLNCCEVRTYLGQDDGAFQETTQISGIWPGAIHAADFNGDGVLDIAGPNAVLLARGDGRFEIGPHFWWPEADWYQMPAGPGAAADLDGDSHLDLVYFDTMEGRTVTGFKGKGDGAFVPAFGFHLWENVDRRIGGTADLDGDGRHDLVTAVYCAVRAQFPPDPSAPGCSAGTNNLSVLLNRIE